jgi:hypothetical protein
MKYNVVYFYRYRIYSDKIASLSEFTSSVTNVNVVKESNPFVWNVQQDTVPVAIKTYKSHLQKRLRNINALCI